MTIDIINQEVLWGVAVWRLLIAVIIIFLGFASRRIIQALFRSVLARRSMKTQVLWDDELVALVPAPLASIVLILI